MHRTWIYAALALAVALPASMSGAAIFRRYFETSSAPVFTLSEYVDGKIKEINEIANGKLAKAEKVRRIRVIISEVENTRKTKKFTSAFEEYVTDLKVQPFQFLPGETEVAGQKTCLQSKDKVMINYDPTAENYNTRSEPLKNVLRVIDRICS
ncbi:MAG: hypothetical protein V4736_04950 [Bdellovibrionota bacterium]